MWCCIALPDKVPSDAPFPPFPGPIRPVHIHGADYRHIHRPSQVPNEWLICVIATAWLDNTGAIGCPSVERMVDMPSWRSLIWLTWLNVPKCRTNGWYAIMAKFDMVDMVEDMVECGNVLDMVEDIVDMIWLLWLNLNGWNTFVSWLRSRCSYWYMDRPWTAPPVK